MENILRYLAPSVLIGGVGEWLRSLVELPSSSLVKMYSPGRTYIVGAFILVCFSIPVSILQAQSWEVISHQQDMIITHFWTLSFPTMRIPDSSVGTQQPKYRCRIDDN